MKLTLALILAALGSGAYACDCGALADTFEKTVKVHNEKYGEKYPLTVVTGRVAQWENFKESYHGKFPLQMKFEVEKIYQGAVAAKTITVKGDNGMMCRPYITKFPEKTRWTLALMKEKSGNYYVSICGVYYRKEAR